MKKVFLQLKSLKLVLFLVFGMTMFLSQLSASHLVGSDISYQCTSTAGIYKVTMKIYRDCAGITLCNGCTNAIPNGTVSGCTTGSSGWSTQIVGASSGCVGVNFGSFTLTAVAASSGFDIIQTCNNVNTICTNCNTRTAGTFSPGIEVYTYEGNVDLSGIPSTCCNVTIGANTCCRNGALTTIVPGSFQTVCTVNRCQTPCNSAPTFSNNAIALVCAGVDFVYNLGAIDPDGDSLSYAFGQPLQGIGTSVTYVSPYSAAYPFPYFGAPNPNATYPAGLRIDPLTGDVLFRPIGVFVSNLVIEVTQWKLVSGVRVNVGVTRRDVQFQTLLCLSNRVPIIKTYRNGILQVGSNYTIGFGQQICLDLVAEDQQDLTTSPQILADTTDLKWNNPGLYNPLMANATFIRNYILSNRATSGPKADSFKFCWTPPLSAVRLQPHNFTVTGSDRFCPVKAFAIRGITIKVETKTIFIDSNTKSIYCNNKVTSTNVNYRTSQLNLLSGNVFTVQLSDSSGSFTNATNIGTKTAIDTFGFIPITVPTGLFLNRNYKIRVNCSSDTVNKGTPYAISLVLGFNTPVITNNRDSFCKGLVSTFKVTPNTAGLTIKWLKNNAIMDNEIRDSLLVDSANTYRAIVSNTGCSDTSNVKYLMVFQKPIVGFSINNPIQCLNGNNFLFNDTSTITAGSYTRKWNLGVGLNDTSILSNPTRIYTTANTYSIKLLATSNNGCKDSVVKSIIVRPKPVIGFRINNSIQCLNGNSFIYTDTTTISSGTFLRKWNFGNGISDTSLLANPTKTYSTANTFSVKLLATSSYGCKDSIVKTITVNSSPVASCTINNWQQCLNNNNIICTETSTISSGSITKRIWQVYNASNGNPIDTSTNSIYNKVFISTGNYYILLTSESNNGCSDVTQKDFGIYQLDATTLSSKSTICSANGNGTATILVPDRFAPISYLWSSNARNQITQTAVGLKEDTYQVTATDANNCSVTKSIKVLNTPNVNTQVPITNIAMLDQSNAASFSQYYNYDLPLSINPNPNNAKNYADAGKYFRFKIQTKNNKINGQSIVNGFCKVRSNSPYITITDSIVALNNIAYNGKLWSADEFEVYINPTTPKGSNLYLDLVVEESANQFSTGCLSIPITPLIYSPNTSLTIDDDNIPDSHGNNNDTCELGEAIEFYPWLNNVSDKNAQYVKGTLLNNNNFTGVNIWNNIKGVNDTVMNNTWWNLAFGKPTSIDRGSDYAKPAMDFVFDYANGAPRNNFDLNLAVAAGFRLLADTTLSLVQWSLPYNFKSEVGPADALQINPQTLSYTSLIGSNKVAITSNRSWAVTSNQSWVTLNKNAGIGNDSINITVAANTGLPRTALITFTAGLITKTLTINQDSFTTADVLSLDKDSINTSFGASLNTVQVSSNRSWTVSSNQSWCGVSTVSGSGNGNFNVINSINNTGLFRNALVTVTAGTITKNLYVGQSATVGINNPIFNDQQISIYPNPNHGNFTIQLKNTADKNGTITIVDMLGRIVYETLYKLSGNEDIISISQLHLQAGTYNIIIGKKAGVTSRKSFVVIGE